MMSDLKSNMSLSDLVSLDDAEFRDALEDLQLNLKAFKASNEIDEDFVK